MFLSNLMSYVHYKQALQFARYHLYMFYICLDIDNQLSTHTEWVNNRLGVAGRTAVWER